jgi:hypothetical protein
VPRRESQILLDRAAKDLASLVALAPDAITSHPSVPTGEVILRFRGLPFVRSDAGGVVFDAHGSWKELNYATELTLKKLVLSLQNFRNPLASQTSHPLFRGQPESWLQSIVAQDVSRVDIALDPTHLYEQVFAQSGGQRGILDLLAITRAGRLAIFELKATENVDLPLQAADYGSRIRRHQQAGDLARYGYFHGIELQTSPPLVYLISPVLRFHPSTDALLRFLSPEIEITRIGLSEKWRSALRVMFRR